MTTKLTGWCGKLLAVIFTSIVAPLLVNLAVRETSDKASRPDREEPAVFRQVEAPQPTYPSDPSYTRSHYGRAVPQCQASFAASRPVQIVRIIVRGSGLTPELALQDSLHIALRQALASVVDTETWAKNGSVLYAEILRNSGGLIVEWKDLRVRKEWGRKGLLYQNEAAVEVNLTALVERLRRNCSTGWNAPFQTTPGQPPSPLPRIQ